MARYSAASLKGDIFGGVTAGVIALPLALAFGVASGAGPAAGLYGAICVGLIAALCGGTPTQVSGPTGPITVVTASALVALGGDLGAVAAVILLAGLFQVLFGAFRLGDFIKFVPYPVVSGFMSGIGIIIILLQASPLLGGPAVNSPLEALLTLRDAAAGANLQSVVLAGMTMGIVFFTPPRITRVLPSPLIALLAGTALASGLAFSVPTIGDIPSGLPELRLPSFSLATASRVLMLGITVAVLASLDSLLTSLVADSLTKTRHNSNRELIGQGLGNMAAALAGGIAGAGATMRTVINIKSGARGRFSGAVHALFLLAVLLGMGPFISRVPMAVLAGILVKVGVDILDYRFLKVARQAPRPDLVVAATVFFLTVFVDLIMAVGVGVTMASVLLAWRMSRQSNLCIMELPDHRPFAAHEQDLQQETGYRIRIVTIQGPFFFGSTSFMLDNVDRLLGTRVVLFECLDVPFIDLSAAFALQEMCVRLKAAGIVPLIAAIPDVRVRLLGLGFDEVVGKERMFESYEDAIWEARRLVGD